MEINLGNNILKINKDINLYKVWEEERAVAINNQTWSATSKLPKEQMYGNGIIHEAGHKIFEELEFTDRKEWSSIWNSLKQKA